jgi:hypothetical protein
MGDHRIIVRGLALELSQKALQPPNDYFMIILNLF